MSKYDYYDYFHKPSQPIKTDEGIKAKSQSGKFTKNWWATRWVAALEKIVDAGRLRRGRKYARSGQVLNITEVEHTIKAEVQGSRTGSYQVSIEVGTLSDEQWQAVLDTLADQSIFTAQLLAGEMPQDIEEVFDVAKVNLLPHKPQELITSCSCPDWANPCKHVAAVYYIVGERFDEDPFMIFRLRGRTQEQILVALRQRRSTGSEDESGSVAEEQAQPLTLDHFWQPKNSMTIKTNIKAPATTYPILKRLGQPPFLKNSLIDLLGPGYQTITDQALRLAFNETTSTDET